jgi:phosphatidate cytidylyltransferase
MAATALRQSDLGVRFLSSVLMVAVAATALWFGGMFWLLFVAVVALAVIDEWIRLALAIASTPSKRLAWIGGGLIYISAAAWVLAEVGASTEGIYGVGLIVGAVIGVDVGGYFVGRTIGGRKIAPSISPSKTWAGLVGGALGASLMLALIMWAWHSGLCDAVYRAPNDPNGEKFGFDGPCSFGMPPISYSLVTIPVAGSLVAIVAQIGDFFESWMKRRAGVKDSGALIPGHGGLLDRVDGLLAVCFVFGLVHLSQVLT